MPVASTNLKRNFGNTEDSLCDWIQLQGVNVLLVSTWKTHLCEYNPIFDCVLHSPLGRSAHQWGVAFQTFFEFTEQRAQRFPLCDDYYLARTGSCKETNDSNRREMQF